MTTPEADNAPATPSIKRHRGPSVVWLLPFLAAIIAGWLVIKNYQDAGIMIEVQFETAEGLEADVTRVMYRGLQTGKIKSLKLNDDLKSVTAIIEMEKETSEILVDGTRFWLVKPQISLSGVKGLDTLLSGYYIELQPGQGKERFSFVADNEPAPPLKDRQGLYLSLLADSAQSIQRGAKVYYRQIEVGEVINFGLTNNADQIRIELFIEPAYRHLITDSTRFWKLAEQAQGLTIAPGWEPTCTLGPLVSAKQQQRVLAYIEQARSDGGTIVTGGGKGSESGYFVEPTVITGLAQESCCVQEEIFGPVVVVQTFRELEELVLLANDSPYGLAASIWSNDLAAVNRLVPEIESGMIWVNGHNLLDACMPFGGFKQSGIGRELGDSLIEHYTEQKSVVMIV